MQHNKNEKCTKPRAMSYPINLTQSVMTRRDPSLEPMNRRKHARQRKMRISRKATVRPEKPFHLYIVYVCLQVIQCFWVLVGSETLSITCPTRSVSTDIVSRFAVYFCMCFCFKTATGESTKSKDHEDGPAKTQTCQESKSG